MEKHGRAMGAVACLYNTHSMAQRNPLDAAQFSKVGDELIQIDN